jgi:hypothetical protein
LEKTTPVDQAALFTFDRHVQPLVTFEQWNSIPVGERVELAVRKLAENSPGWLATDLGGALVAAAETLAETTGKSPSPGLRQIIVISDLQEGSRLEALQNYEWPKEISLQIEPLRTAHTDNASLQLITATDEEKHGNSTSLRVRVSNEPFSKKEQFKMGWVQPDGRTFVEKPVDLYVPAGQSRTIVLPIPTNGVSSERILLQGDDNDFDNSVFAVPPEQTRLHVLYCGAASENDSRGPLYFLRRAFQETQRQSVQLLVRSENQPLLSEDARTAALYIVTGALTDDRERLLREQFSTGKTLLFSL